MPRSPAGCREQATSSGDQGIRRVFQPSAAAPGDWTEDSGGDPTPASLTEARKAHRGSGPQWIAPRLPACCVSPESPKQPRTRFSASTVIALGPEYERSMAASIPLKRLGTVEGIAYAGLFLASKEASYIAGQTIVVDGAQIFPES